MKKAIILVAAIISGIVAKAEGYQYLYWQVQPEKVLPNVKEYKVAYFYTFEEFDNKTAIGVTGVTPGSASPVIQSSDLSSFSSSDLSSFGSNYFVWELAYWDDEAGKATTVGTTDVFTYAQLSEYMASYSGGSDLPKPGELFAPTFVIPEPTSGMLMLIGLAGLALRRKRA